MLLAATINVWNIRIEWYLCGSESGLSGTDQRNRMPATLEVVCNDADCTLDMFELHYTYDMPDDVDVSDFSCPYCGGTDSLEAIEL